MTSGKNVLYMHVKKCKVHQEIAGAAINALEAYPHAFNKEQLLKETGYVRMEDSIRWDYIQRMIEDPEEGGGGKYSLMPVAASFFTDFARYDKKGDRGTWEARMAKDPEKFAARGYGKKTAGYARVCEVNGDIALFYELCSEAEVAGKMKAHRKRVAQIQDKAPMKMLGRDKKRLVG